MAISISGWSGAGARTFSLAVVESSYDEVENSSIVEWTLTVSGGTQSMDTYVSGWVNGTRVFDLVKHATDNGGATWNGFPANVGSSSGTLKVYHNDNGQKTINYTIEGYAVSYVIKRNEDGSLTLHNNDRSAPTVGLSVTGVTKDSISISVSSNGVEADKWEYRLNSGNWVTFNSTSGTSKSTTISGLSMNTLYTIDTRARKALNGIYGYSSAVDQKTLGAAEISSANNVTLGSACNIKWSPLDSSHRFKVSFSVGDASYETGLLTSSSSGVSVSGGVWTYTGYAPSLATFAPKITTSRTGSMTIVLTTYLSDGTTVVGSDTKIITATVPDSSSTKPSVSSLSLAQGSTKSGLTNVGGGELCVKTLSNIAAVATVGAQYGAKVVSVNIVVSNKTYTVNVPSYNTSTTTASIASDVLSESGTLSITAVATDSRGLVSAVKTGTIYVADYFKPSGTISYELTNISSPQGVSIKTDVSWQIAPILDSANKPVNSGVVAISRKKVSTGATGQKTIKTIQSSSSTTTTPTSDYSGDGSWTAEQQAITDGNSETYEYTLTVTDIKGQSYAANYIVSTGVIAVSYLGGGKGATFFGEAQNEGLWVVENGVYKYQGAGSVEYIKGTQTGSTNAWTGITKDVALYDGKMIMYVLPYAGTSSGATLNLTLAGGATGGGTTGAKSIYRYGNTTAVTTHYAANSRILLIYDGVNNRWNCSAYYNSNTTYTAGTGLSLSSTTFNHSNSTTEKTTQAIYPITFDAQGHITGAGTAAVDYIVEEGTWLSGKYIKWNSGMAECYGWTSKTTAIGSSYGTGGIHYTTASVTFPSIFTASPSTNITLQRNGGLIWPSIYSLSATSASFYIGSATAENSATIYIHVHAKGTWK